MWLLVLTPHTSSRCLLASCSGLQSILSPSRFQLNFSLLCTHLSVSKDLDVSWRFFSCTKRKKDVLKGNNKPTVTIPSLGRRSPSRGDRPACLFAHSNEFFQRVCARGENKHFECQSPRIHIGNVRVLGDRLKKEREEKVLCKRSSILMNW